MKVYGDGWLEQRDKSKQRYKCRKWMIRFKTEYGKKSKFFVGSFSEAKAAREQYYLELVSEKKSGSVMFSDYSKKWLQFRKNNPDYSSNTVARDERMINTLNYWFGTYTLAEIKPPLIKDIMLQFHSVTGKQLTGTGKNMHFSELSSILKSAQRDGLIQENPMENVPMPKRDTKEKRCLSAEEMNHLIDCLNKEPVDGRVLCMYFMACMALRSQEAFAIKWKDINFDKGILHVQRAYKTADGSVGLPKSKAGNRFIPIPPFMLEKLKGWYERYKEEEWSTDYVCMTTQQKIMTGTAMRKWFQRFKKRHDVDHIAFHELRHSNLTLAARNMNQFDLQKYAGWSSLEPAKIYIHPDNESMSAFMESTFG